MINSYTIMDSSIIDSNWDKTIKDLKELVNKVDEESIKELLKNLRDLLFEKSNK